MGAVQCQSLELDAREQRLYDVLGPLFEQECRRVVQLLASKDDAHLFGQTEFDLRDRVHDLAARSLEAAAEERPKKGVRRS